jgi:hypothetical protein
MRARAKRIVRVECVRYYILTAGMMRGDMIVMLKCNYKHAGGVTVSGLGLGLGRA